MLTGELYLKLETRSDESGSADHAPGDDERSPRVGNLSPEHVPAGVSVIAGETGRGPSLDPGDRLVLDRDIDPPDDLAVRTRSDHSLSFIGSSYEGQIDRYRGAFGDAVGPWGEFWGSWRGSRTPRNSPRISTARRLHGRIDRNLYNSLDFIPFRDLLGGF
jgi:hypothetical protein